MHKLLVTGALGVIGRAVVERLSARGDVEVVGLARRAPGSHRIATRRTSSTPLCSRSRI
ncbi:MAG TPA: NAD-dependent epimerase/dehydratase family protein [Myxococcota bacterium]|nr:NAD-dependent epimerase/dehydratase family protein [Myxococcota bacterium]